MAAGGRSVACCAAVLLAAALLLSAPTTTGSAHPSLYACPACARFRELVRSAARSPLRLMQRSSESWDDASVARWQMRPPFGWYCQRRWLLVWPHCTPIQFDLSSLPQLWIQLSRLSFLQLYMELPSQAYLLVPLSAQPVASCSISSSLVVDLLRKWTSCPRSYLIVVCH
jgi:hypothetical protein